MTDTERLKCIEQAIGLIFSVEEDLRLASDTDRTSLERGQAYNLAEECHDAWSTLMKVRTGLKIRANTQ